MCFSKTRYLGCDTRRQGCGTRELYISTASGSATRRQQSSTPKLQVFQGCDILSTVQGVKGAISRSCTSGTAPRFAPVDNAVLHQNFVSDYQAKWAKALFASAILCTFSRFFTASPSPLLAASNSSASLWCIGRPFLPFAAPIIQCIAR